MNGSPSRLISRVQLQSAIKARHGIGPPAQSGVGQSQVSVGLNMCRILAQNALEQFDRLLELSVRQELERAVKELGVGHISIQGRESSGLEQNLLQRLQFL